jgi:two-component system response regulator AtoC
MSIHKILVVDDEPLIRKYIEEILNRHGYEVSLAESGTRAIQILEKEQFDLVITDMKMSNHNGLDVLRRVKALREETLVIVITAYGSIENVIEAMQLGAYNYIVKPFEPEQLESTITLANKHRQLKLENQYLKQISLSSSRSSHHVIAQSPCMIKLMQQIEIMARSKANIFISGESGTGKEVIAQAIHRLSPRNNAPFIRVNCAAMPESLIESEFFGHEKGAFTGADNKREGRFELADQGSLLLDEITEIPFHLQAKLLRVIQEQEFERLGGKKTIKIDVRIISTSNRDLPQAILEKQFREDLYYRLNVIPVHIPPLRERREDIILLCESYLKTLCQENHRPLLTLSQAAKDQLLAHSWPGNVRELVNVMERSVVLCQSSIIEAEDLWQDHRLKPANSLINKNLTLKEIEHIAILEALQKAGQQKEQAANSLGLTLKMLERKLLQYTT